MRDLSRPARWNTIRAAKWGALFGLAYFVAMFIGDGVPSDAERIARAFGGLIGGVMVGVLLFGSVAALRNLILRAQ
ncbi:Formate dehydrogenase -O, gamma subunit [Hyphomicrobiales bacterium]|jgi:hypothetical protein|nr:Formate dehydrogenase -O, gamma subunit [Hyphomicrobiales bacterium]CAH1696936.1 Formate dehydrogenase -O, gamma subunit [Hyphomicrobiales bacterium]